MKRFRVTFFSLLTLILAVILQPLYACEAEVQIGERTSWPILAVDEMLAIHPRYINYDTPSLSWNYPQALILHAIWEAWKETENQKYFDYVKRSVDFYLPDSGGLKTYVQRDFRLDDVLMGRVILNLYAATKEVRYKNAAKALREQLARQPRTTEGGFWHKEIYPNQMWLDGIYMAEPFYAQYASMFNEPQDFDDIADQFIFMAKHSLDSKTGLMYHGWDSSKKEKWANPETGDSPCFWGRSLGWYMMGLVDVLEYFPKDHPKRPELISILQNLSASLLKYEDKETDMWYQVVDQPEAKGNFLESSASAMFAYSFAKGAREKYLDPEFFGFAQKTFDGLINHSVKTSTDHRFVFENTSGTVGLGGDPYRDGSYEYYVNVPKESNDFRGVAPFIMAGLELEKGAPTVK